jgi:hypothetical protein
LFIQTKVFEFCSYWFFIWLTAAGDKALVFITGKSPTAESGLLQIKSNDAHLIKMPISFMSALL